MDTPFDPRPIGIFDSGIGGLTVLRAVAQRLPGESLIYLGDTARVPYGSKSPRTVARYTIQVADFLLARGIKALVVACNTASALGLEALGRHSPVPALGVILPGARLAAGTTRNRQVGIIGTRSTIASGAYPRELTALDSLIRSHPLACPLFVPLAEEGWHHHPATRLIATESLQPLMAAGIDTLILGCTHYPLLAPVIAEVMGPEVTLIDSARAVADALAGRIGPEIRPAPPGARPTRTLLATDVPDRFEEVARRFLELEESGGLERVEMVDLQP
ncbi:MAG: glutamate racemase [Magnetococcales bacterium]|nr:glutamate racemase [Magnetococcales bacterium]